MSALQFRWLNYQFANGNISKEEFASLRERIAQSEQGQTTDADPQRKVFRLHRQTRRVLSQIRVFKSIAACAKYLLLLGALALGYIVADYYKNTGSLSDLSLSVLEKYFTNSAVEPLPSDIKLAAEHLVQKSDWNEQHLQQFRSQWQALDKARQQEYQAQRWFHSFSLALSLHIADQRALLKQGQTSAIKRNLALVKLAKEISGGAVL